MTCSDESIEVVRTYGELVGSIADELALVATSSGRSSSTRDIQVIESYWGLRRTAPETLEEIAVTLQLTRERVRQIKERAAVHLREAYQEAEPPSVVLLLEILQQAGGVIPLKKLSSTFASVLPQQQYRVERFVEMLFDIGAIRQARIFADQLVVARDVSEYALKAARESFSEVLAENSVTVLSDLEDLLLAQIPTLRGAGLTDAARSLAELDHREVLPGVYSARAWHLAEFAAFVLENEGRPLHFTEIANRISAMTGRSIAPASLNSRLNTTRVFVRVGAGDFALASWGTARYGRFDEVIERYLASGRRAEHLSRIQADLLRTYTVAEATIAAMLTMHRETFTHYGGNHWGLVGYVPEVDESLAQLLELILSVAQRPQTVSAVFAALSQLQPLTRTTVEEIARTLYVDGRFAKVGNPKFRTFTVKREKSAQPSPPAHWNP